MNAKVALNIVRLGGFLILGSLVCFIAISFSNGQTTPPKAPDKAKLRERIATIMRETLKRGEIDTGEGYTVITRVPPSPEDIKKIQHYGDDAVSILSGYLLSEDAREYELAMRFLGALGGSRIIEPLREIILFDPSPRKRDFALSSITQAPWDEASPIIRQAAETDPDTHVREVAKDLLINHAPK